MGRAKALPLTESTLSGLCHRYGISRAGAAGLACDHGHGIGSALPGRIISAGMSYTAVADTASSSFTVSAV